MKLALFLISAVCLSFMLFMAIANFIFLKIATKQAEITSGPKVSVLIPARNEENSIVNCLNSLVNQSYKNYEVIVLDDNSTDNTFKLANEFAKKYDFIKVVKGRPLEDGWKGKNFAMQQLSELTSGEVYFFTDADTKHSQESLSWAVTNLEKHKVDAMSAYPGFNLKSFASQLIYSAIVLPIQAFLPLCLVKKSKLKYLTCAIGSIFVIKKDVFNEIGGLSKIKDITVEDIFLARLVKENNYKFIFINARDYVRTEVPQTYRAGVKNTTRSISDVVGIFNILYVFVVLVIMGVCFYPLGMFVASIVGKGLWWMSLIYLLFALLPLVILFFATLTNNFSFWICLLWPLTLFSLFVMLASSVCNKILKKEVVWKGRTINL